MTTALVSSLLRQYGAQVHALLNRYLPGASAGTLEAHLADYPRRGGKMLRPCLMMATARCFGASLDQVIGPAVSLEIFHNALLIHDDIEDYSTHRRGLPALHIEHGVALALWLGDALALRSLQPVLDSHRQLGPRLTLDLLHEIERMSWESAEGQALELGWRHENTSALIEEDYLEMVLKKTCWLAFIFPLRAGALIGSRGALNLEPFIRLGFFIGASFQIQDDVLNLVGDASRYGKEVGGDLREGKRTLMLIRLLRKANESERQNLLEILDRSCEERTDEDVRWILDRMEAYHCIDYARKVAYGLAGAALHEFERLFAKAPPSRDKDFIEGLIVWVLKRSR